ncbi:MAG: aldose 1-epimerase [Gemmatales bacterium]|nr:MAG: aldose 1-epimerase [Gemmatales bacterium]
MGYQVRRESRAATNGLDGTVVVLAGDRCQAEIWPALGCNCYHWHVRDKDTQINLLYAADDLFHDDRPTRSGIPILFPFPNRIRGCVYHWQGKEYRLPHNDSSGYNSIHGFACRTPWRCLDEGADADSAWLTAEFHCSQDAADCLSLWPADHRLRVTFRLFENRLRLDACVENPGTSPLPFGLGFHPYFGTPMAPGGTERDCFVEAPAREFWQLDQCLPTGERKPVDEPRNLTQPRCCSDLKLDDVLVLDRDGRTPRRDGLLSCGRLRQGPWTLQLWASPAFRELVVFTPVHRRAFCLEPYTCVTDAINLQQKGIDAGLLILQPNETWQAVFEMELVKS